MIVHGGAMVHCLVSLQRVLISNSVSNNVSPPSSPLLHVECDSDMPGLDEVSDDEDKGEDDAQRYDIEPVDLDGDSENLAFGTDPYHINAAASGLNGNGNDAISGLPASMTIDEDFAREVHEAGTFII